MHADNATHRHVQASSTPPVTGRASHCILGRSGRHGWPAGRRLRPATTSRQALSWTLPRAVPHVQVFWVRAAKSAASPVVQCPNAVPAALSANSLKRSCAARVPAPRPRPRAASRGSAASAIMCQARALGVHGALVGTLTTQATGATGTANKFKFILGRFCFARTSQQQQITADSVS